MTHIDRGHGGVTGECLPGTGTDPIAIGCVLDAFAGNEQVGFECLTDPTLHGGLEGVDQDAHPRRHADRHDQPGHGQFVAPGRATELAESHAPGGRAGAAAMQ